MMRVNKLSPRIVLLDTNIISTFAKIDQLELLFEIVRKKELGISTSVLHELEDARNVGLSFVEKSFKLIKKKKIIIFSINVSAKR